MWREHHELLKQVLGTAGVVLASGWRVLGNLVAILWAWWGCCELWWAINLLVVNLWVVPVEAQEVLAAILQSLVLECVAIAVFAWIVAFDHPIGAGGWLVQSWFIWLRLVAVVRETGRWKIKTWGEDVKVLFVSSALFVGWWAVVDGLEDKSGLLVVSSLNVGLTSDLEALPTSLSFPSTSSKSLGDSCTAVEISSMLVASWSLEWST